MRWFYSSVIVDSCIAGICIVAVELRVEVALALRSFFERIMLAGGGGGEQEQKWK